MAVCRTTETGAGVTWAQFLAEWAEAKQTLARVDSAKQTLALADSVADRMAEMLVGRTNKCRPDLCRALKKELRDFDMTTGKWKKK